MVVNFLILDTYVEMGNLSCVKSTEDGKSHSDNSKSSGTRGAVNISSIPKIVLDPGSSVNSIPD